MNAVNRKQLFPQLDQSALPDRRQQLLGGNGRRQFRISEMFTPGGDSARRDDNNTVSCGMQLRALTNKFYDVGTVQAARSAR